MTPNRKKCPHVVHFNIPRDWFETNSQNQKHYSEGGKKIRGCRGLLGRVKPWLNKVASSRKWTQVELAWRLALGGQTDSQVAKKNISRQTYPVFHWLIIR